MTFLNRLSTNSSVRVRVTDAFAGTPVFHDALAYDDSDSAAMDKLAVDYAGTVAFHHAGIAFSAAGNMLVVDASAGLPSDTFWQSGLPISAAQSRLCVDPTGAVVYVHQGVPFTGVGAVAVDGEPAPPVEVCYDNGAPNQDTGSEMTRHLQAEEFVTSVDATLNNLQFWTGEGPGAYSGSIYYAIYAYAGGLPGALLVPWAAVTAVTRMATGLMVGGVFPEYAYSGTIADFAATGGTQYFIALHNGPLSNTTQVDMFWETGANNLTGRGLEYDLLDPAGWVNTELEHAFEICGTGSSPAGNFRTTSAGDIRTTSTGDSRVYV